MALSNDMQGAFSHVLDGATAISPRLKGEEFRAEDLDGILDGVSSTGNLNFAVLHAGIADALGPVLTGGETQAGGVDIGSSALYGLSRHALQPFDASEAVAAPAPSVTISDVKNVLQAPAPASAEPADILSSAGGVSFSSETPSVALGDGGANDAQNSAPDLDAALPEDMHPVLLTPGIDIENSPIDNIGPGDMLPGDDRQPGGNDNPPPDVETGGPDADEPGLLDPVENIVDDVVDLVDDVLDDIEEIGDPAIDLVEDVLTPVTDILAPVVEPVVDIVKDGAGDAAGLIDGLLENVGEVSEGGINRIVDILDPLLDPVEDVLEHVGGAVDVVDTPVLDEAGDFVGDIAEEAGDVAQALTEPALQSIEEVANDTDALLDDVTDGVGDLLDSVLSAGGDPLVEFDLAASTDGSAADNGDTSEDGEGALLDLNVVAPTDLAAAEGVGDAVQTVLEETDAELSLGGGETIDSVDLVENALNETDLDFEASEITVDVDALLAPVDGTIDDALDLLGEVNIDSELTLSDEGGEELIGDLALNVDSEDGLVSELLGGTDLPEPDSVLSEGLSGLDEDFGGLVGGSGLGGLFG
ncbi:MAG: hypothetical protein AB7P23_03130 [Amphiplicatus sp.]